MKSTSTQSPLDLVMNFDQTNSNTHTSTHMWILYQSKRTFTTNFFKNTNLNSKKCVHLKHLITCHVCYIPFVCKKILRDSDEVIFSYMYVEWDQEFMISKSDIFILVMSFSHHHRQFHLFLVLLFIHFCVHLMHIDMLLKKRE